MCKLFGGNTRVPAKEHPVSATAGKRVIEISPLKNRRLVAALI
jgi:hypothetical protein